MTSRQPSLEEIVYRSKFARWHERASVRAKPRRVVRDDDGARGIYFPTQLVPAAQHELVRRLDDHATERIQVQQLHHYLDFTTELEQRVVNPICAAISRGRSGLQLPDEMLREAFNIYTDEAYHAQFSDDMQRQVAAVTGVVPAAFGTPPFVRLAALHERRDDPLRLFTAVVSETLISSILSAIPRDPRVVPAVRELVADHAVDEGVHHAYFAQLLEFAWPQLDRQQRSAVGVELPGLVRTFLDPDLGAQAAILADAGLTPDEIGQVLTDVHPPAEVSTAARRASRKTLSHLARVGVLDLPEVAEAFTAAELLGADPDLGQENA